MHGIFLQLQHKKQKGRERERVMVFGFGCSSYSSVHAIISNPFPLKFWFLCFFFEHWERWENKNGDLKSIFFVGRISLLYLKQRTVTSQLLILVWSSPLKQKQATFFFFFLLWSVFSAPWSGFLWFFVSSASSQFGHSAKIMKKCSLLWRFEVRNEILILFPLLGIFLF